jgi:hypothetical protein
MEDIRFKINLGIIKIVIMKRNATAVWNGSLKEGAGKLTTQKYDLENTQYSFGSRFETGVGTNPEELIAAAHSGASLCNYLPILVRLVTKLKVLKLNV